MLQSHTAVHTAAERVALIVASIDWEPTCFPGEEKQAIVRQVLLASMAIDGQAHA